MQREGGSAAQAGLASVLAAVPLFQGLSPAALDLLAGLAERVEITAGSTLIRQGEASTDLYVVVSGTLAVYRVADSGRPARQAEIYAGETVGEMSLLTGEPRSATVIAVRDCELFRLTRDHIASLVEREPAFGLRVAELLARRLAATHEGRRPLSRPRSFTLAPHPGIGDGARGFAESLRAELARFGATALMTAADAGAAHETFLRHETASQHVLLLADAAPTDWSAFCRRQADVILLVGTQDLDPETWIGLAVAAGEAALVSPETELVLIGPGDACALGTGRWLDATGASGVHHVGGSRDTARLARLLARRAVTLVLSGGGARGFAHLGVIRALREAGVEIDVFGGASMGALIAAGYAAGWPHDEIVARVRSTFVTRRLLNDPIVPVVALFRGKRVEATLREAYGDLHIEDLRQPFFCVTTDLTRGRPVIHRRGLLRHWLRATVAVPGILRPVRDGDTMHIDGGVIDNLPIDAAAAVPRGAVIAVDAGFDDEIAVKTSARPNIPLWQRLLGGRLDGEPSIIEILWRVGTIGNVSRGAREGEGALLIRPPIGEVGFLDWRALDYAMAQGYEHTARLIEERRDFFGAIG